jgi:addiction module RelB/DinJ family antitoxin
LQYNYGKEKIMAKTSTISARIDPDLKKRVNQVFKDLGLTSAQAITLFLQTGGDPERAAFQRQSTNRNNGNGIERCTAQARPGDLYRRKGLV